MPALRPLPLARPALQDEEVTPTAVNFKLLDVIRRLAWEWLVHHSSYYAPMDAPRPKWDRLLKRFSPPLSHEKPATPDKFFPPIRGGNMSYWVLMGQMIGPCFNREEPVHDLDTYYELWAEGLRLCREYEDATGHNSMLAPYLWTLEAPPPHFVNHER